VFGHDEYTDDRPLHTGQQKDHLETNKLWADVEISEWDGRELEDHSKTPDRHECRKRRYVTDHSWY